MGTIIAIIIVFILAIVGIKEFLIALAIGGVIGIISAIIQAVEQKKGFKTNNHRKHNTSNINKQSYWDDEDQVVNDMIIMEMMDQEEQKRKSLKKDTFNWETDCESCEELLEDCECDWHDNSKEDISQSDWNNKGSRKDGTSFDNFGGK